MNKKMKGLMKKLTAFAVVACVAAAQPGVAANATAKYSDVKDNEWYASPVQKLSDAGVVKGKDGKFAPDDNVSRAEFLTFLYGIDNITPVGANSDTKFSDVAGSDWFSKNIEWAVSLGIAYGYENGKFKPNGEVTRAEAAVFIKRFMDATKKSMNTIGVKNFADAASIPEWANESVKSCVETGIIKGYPDNTFRPSGKVSRAEAAAMISVIYEGNSAQVSGDKSFADKFAAAAGKTETENYLISPYSAKLALAMTANGAAGSTKKEMLSVLGISDINKFNEDAKLQKAVYAEAAEALTLDVNNSLWLNKSKVGDSKFKSEFSKLADNFYGAKVGVVTESDALKVINGWISEKTRGKITDCLDSPNFSSALVNTIYFKSAWKNVFNKDYTSKDEFMQADGKAVKTDFMHLNEDIEYYSGDGVRMISLPYDNNSYKKGDKIDKTFSKVKLSMYVVLADGNKSVDMDALIKSAKLTSVPVNVIMPKFEIKYGKNISKILKDMGMTEAFSDNADFSNMLELPQAIGDVIQNTYIKLDEEGTEAAAATVVAMRLTSALGDTKEPVVFKADKPFQFAIYDNNSKEILFSGRYSMVN